MSSLTPRERTLNQVERKRWNLRHVESTNDRSHPFIVYNTVIKQNNRYVLYKAIKHNPAKLRHVANVSDRSAPIIDSTFQLRYTNRKVFLDGVLNGAENFYNRLVNASKYMLPVSGFQSSVNQVVQSGKDTVQSATGGIGHAMSSIIDMATHAVKSIAAAASIPATDPQRDDINAHKLNSALLAEISDNRLKLHHSAPPKDRSRPFIPSAEALADYNSNHVTHKQLDRKAEVHRCIQGKAVLRSLNHVSIARDHSKPSYLPYRVNIRRNSKRELVEALKQPLAELQHIETTQIDDRSAPRIDAGKKHNLQNGARKALLQEVKTVAGQAQM